MMPRRPESAGHSDYTFAKEQRADGRSDWTDQMSESGEDLPGNILMWIFILGDVLVFAGLLVGFSVMKILHPAEFTDAQAQLSPWVATLETFALIVSGWMTAIAVARQKLDLPVVGYLVASVGFGAMFLVFKIAEYSRSFSVFDYESRFAQIYYLTTGFHALHVILGLILLSVASHKAQRSYLPDYARYWHFTDIVWLLIFPTIYVPR